MTSVNIDQALSNALEHHRAGRLAEAQAGYQQVLSHQPNHGGALYLLGVMAHQSGNHEAAVQLILRAISANPGVAEFHCVLGEVYRVLGRSDEAIAAYRRAITLKGDYADAYLNLGITLRERGLLQEAVAAYRQTIALQPDQAAAYSNLGVALGDLGQFDQAIAAHRQAVILKPDVAEAHSNLGVALQMRGQLDEAIAAYRRTITLKPDFAEAYYNLAGALRDRGQFEEAIVAFRQAVSLKPGFTEAHYNLGNALRDRGRLDEAMAAFRRAIALKSDFAEAHYNLGEVYRALRRTDDAIAAYRQAIALKSGYADAYMNLGNALRSRGQLDEAVAAYRRVTTLKPDEAAAYSNLGVALRDRGKLEEAIAAHRRAITLKPDLAEAHSNLGVALQDRGQLEEAIAAYRQAITLNSANADVYMNLGNALREVGQLEEAIVAYRRAASLKPDFAAAHCNLANALREQGKLEEAIAAFRRAIALEPDLAQTHGNLGNAFGLCGQLDQAIDCFRTALSIRGDLADVHSSLVYMLHYHPDYDAEAIFAEHQEWARRHAAPLAAEAARHGNDRSTNRRLRIGYVSPNFRDQAESFFVVPLLESHNHGQFEVHCYADVSRPDQITTRLRRSADVWHDVLRDDDAQLAERIRRDGIDVLVDLTMHMARNRALVFARKPAPIQVAWLAYPGGTGLPTMDYRITDAFMDPPGQGDGFYLETSIRLPGCWCCYDPLTDIAGVGARMPGPVRFGSLNNPAKHNASLLRLWARIMLGDAESRLLLPVRGDAHREEIRRVFGASGIAPDRLDFIGFVERAEYLRLYDGIDLCLDPLPYNGITTTCDALWMGVPVVSLAGNTPQGRAGLSILSAVGLPDLVAREADDYVQLAVELAGDLPRLAELRSSLRQRMERSPLMDGARFARNMEAAFRQMWRQWCTTAR